MQIPIPLSKEKSKKKNRERFLTFVLPCDRC